MQHQKDCFVWQRLYQQTNGTPKRWDDMSESLSQALGRAWLFGGASRAPSAQESCQMSRQMAKAPGCLWRFLHSFIESILTFKRSETNGSMTWWENARFEKRQLNLVKCFKQMRQSGQDQLLQNYIKLICSACLVWYQSICVDWAILSGMLRCVLKNPCLKMGISQPLEPMMSILLSVLFFWSFK